MTLPNKSINHIKASHRKYQFLTILFTTLTLAAALAAAVSGIQLSNLNSLNKKTGEANSQPAPESVPKVPDHSAFQEIDALKSELAREKSSSLKMKAKIEDLNNQIMALKKKTIAPKPPAAAPPKAVVPADIIQNKVSVDKPDELMPPPSMEAE